MKFIFLFLFIGVSNLYVAQTDTIKTVETLNEISGFSLAQGPSYCAKTKITKVSTNKKGTKRITKGICYTIIGYYTHRDPPPPIYSKGKRFRLVERIYGK
jgi:hypothetical protein